MRLRRGRPAALLALVFWLLAPGAGRAQTFYPFSVDQDRLSGAADFSFLNQPLEAKDRLFVRDGHFFKVGPDLEPNTADDERVRLFGMNLAFGANFPSADEAPRIAARLRRLGVNLVRLHHMDSSPDSTPANANSVLTTGPYPTFNDVAVQRLRNFLLALKAEGVYANVNLHVGYTFRPSADNIPALPSGAAFPTQSKPLHMIHPRLVELQAQFVRGLFERLGLKGDPVLGMAELNNETSILYAHQNGSLDTTALGDYRASLESSWNRFLRQRYSTDDDLRAAWGPGVPDGADILPPSWRPLEIHSGAAASMTSDPDGTVRVVVPTAAASGAPIVILKKVGFSVSASESYVAEVEIRADLPAGQSRSIYWDVKQDVSPWRTVTGKSISVTGEWQKARMAFTPTFAMDSIGRFGLSVEKCEAPLYVRNARIYTGGQRSADASESLAASNYALPSSTDNSTEGRTNDYLAFLSSLDRDYNRALLSAVRDTNDALLPVTGTQMGFGGLMLIDAQQDLDFFDEHFYIDHYNFPNTAWDGRDWRFQDSSSLATQWSTFLDVAAARVSGRPYTVSEFNQPWPNTKGAELDPTLAAFAAFQDWDALVHFAYEHSRTWDAGVPHGFNVNGDWAKFVNTGQSALLFRWGLVSAARDTVRIPAPEAVRRRFTRERRNGSFAPAFNLYNGYQDSAAIRHRVEIDPAAETADWPADVREAPGETVESDTGELLLHRAARIVTLNTPYAAGLFGELMHNARDAGLLSVQLAPSARGIANILLTPLDGKPLIESARLLLTNPGYTLRTQPGTTPARPQRIITYPNQTTYLTLEPDQANKPSGNLNGGSAPVWMESVEAEVSLRLPGPLRVYPLDGSGSRQPELPLERTENGWRFRLGSSPWYEITSGEE